MDRLGRSTLLDSLGSPPQRLDAESLFELVTLLEVSDQAQTKRLNNVSCLLYNQTSYTRGLMKIQKQSTAALRKRRQALLHQLPPLKAILRGSLIERYKRCGKPGCKCADGPGHGPKYYLSVSYPGPAATDGLRAAGVLRQTPPSSWPTIIEPARS